MVTTATPHIRPVVQNRMKKHSQRTSSKALSTKYTKQVLRCKGTLVPPTHRNSWNLFPVLEGSCNCVATTWMPQCPGLGPPQLPPSSAQQCRAGRTREATQAPRQGEAWHGLTFFSKRLFPILHKGISSPKAHPSLSARPP